MHHPDCDGNSRRKLCTYDCELCFSRSLASGENSYLLDSENNDIDARQIFKNTKKSYNFFCRECNHRFSYPAKNIYIYGCPFCTVMVKRLCEDEDCKFCEERSFVSSDRRDQWDYAKNTTTPRQVALNSHTKYSFICDNPNCLHPFEAALNKVNSGTWCPYCCSTRKICPDKKCKICYKVSFASVSVSKWWSPKNPGVPSDYTTGTTQKFLFDCPNCNHEFSATLAKISGSARWCPYCAIPSKKLCEDEDCDFCYQRSFASCEKQSLWSSKNKKTPRQVLLRSHDIYIFDCDLCNREYKGTPDSVSQGRWCGCRKKKTETKLLTWLHENFPGQVTYQPKFDWCKSVLTKKYYPFDYLIKIPGQKIHKILELDGLQHFQQVMNWTSPEETRARDYYKEYCARSNGFSVIRISQEDVLYDKIDWEDLLMQVLPQKHPKPLLVELYDGIESIERVFTLNFVGLDDA